MNTNEYSRSNRNSTFVLLAFVVAIFFLIGISEVFKGSSRDQGAESQLLSPIRADILANIKTIKIKNNLGTYTLTKDNNSWLLKEPRLMPANTDVINSLLSDLASTSVKSIVAKDPINLSNFALENPTVSVDLFTELDEQLKIQIGLINPINNTTYISVTDNDSIFQVDVFKTNFQSYRLSDLIDSSVFSPSVSEVIEFTIFNRDYKDPTNVLIRGEENWKSNKYKTISKENVDKKIEKILNIDTHMIIDKQNEELKTMLANYLEKPLYRVILKTKDKKIEYQISSLLKAIPELKLEKRQYFLMTASDRQYTYVISKANMNEFYIRYSDLK